MSVLKLNVGDKIFFTEDNWNTRYEGTITGKHEGLLSYYMVYGKKYGRANCSEYQVKKIEK